ncbi:MAG: adenosylcobinamide-GDP ribazoletransferase [Lachnospiraceae bacterium]|nr:adenosylcobinamide-GDP ribazoletransferase [Lachnospiraceae bacterium]
MKSILIMFSVYSRIPIPGIVWDEKSARYAICSFPLVGIVIAALEWGLLTVARMFSVPQTALAALIMAVPILVTGGIHLDGLIDTADAANSYKTAEEKQQILKDPHVGAFGVIRLILYLLLAFAGISIYLSTDPDKEGLWASLLIFVLARALSGLAAESFEKAKKDGMLTGLLGDKTKKSALVLLLTQSLVCVGVMAYLSLTETLFVLVLLLLLMIYFRFVLCKAFGGISGDLSGWFLCMAELLGIWGFVIAGWIV